MKAIMIEIDASIHPDNNWDGVDTCDVIDAPVWDSDFCSMAERRSDEE